MMNVIRYQGASILKQSPCTMFHISSTSWRILPGPTRRHGRKVCTGIQTRCIRQLLTLGGRNETTYHLWHLPLFRMAAIRVIFEQAGSVVDKTIREVSP